MNEQSLERIIEAEIREMVQTRYNVVTGLIEFSMDKGVTYSSLTDRVEKTILRGLRANGHKIGVNTVRNILQSDFSNPYNPFEEYFNGLTKWDGETDHISELCKTVDVENDEYFDSWVKKWIVGIVANMLSETATNHQVLVLTGGQGIGKTTWFDNLVPIKLNNYSNTGYMNPESKDAQIQASECFLVNMDELSSLNSKNIEGLKQLITQKKMRVRKPYGFNPENLIKRATFCGSTNEDQFLFDNTGNRRFLCFKALDIHLDILREINIDFVYAQAYDLYQKGFQYWFDKVENKLIEENNTVFVNRSVEEEAIQIRFEPVKPEDATMLTLRYTATEIAVILSSYGLINRSQSMAQKVGKALSKLGYHSSKSNGKMLYLLSTK
jgi:predicted P-loop ATPase